MDQFLKCWFCQILTLGKFQNWGGCLAPARFETVLVTSRHCVLLFPLVSCLHSSLFLYLYNYLPMAANQENIPPPNSLKLKILGKLAKAHTKAVTTKQQKPKAPTKPPKQTKWSPKNSAELIRVLTEQQAAGNQADNSWKGCVWTVVELALCDSEFVLGGAPKDAKQCNGHWDKVRIQISSIMLCC
jgi:hypothetical protein